MSCIKAFNFTSLWYSGYISAAIVFGVMSMRGEVLEAGPAFTLLACYSYASIYIASLIGHAIQALSETNAVLKRIKEVLTLEEQAGHLPPS